MESFDLLIKNGEIIDGTGEKGFIGDVAVDNGKVIKIADHVSDEAKEVINADGHVVCPGFIDPHAHNDGWIMYDSSNIYKLSQGVTTEINGNCGEGLCPVSDKFYDVIYEYYRPYYPTEDFRLFTSGRFFYDKIASLPLGTNIGFHCAHGTLRMSTMGFSQDKANASQLREMKAKLRECLEAGAMGMSTGLVYSPGCFADTDEIVELCNVVAEYGGVYASHIRSEGYKLVEAVEEAIEIARRANVRTVISHLKCLGRNYWGLSGQITSMIEEARAEGVEIYADQYPYTRSCTVLHWPIPIEYTAGGFINMCEKLQDPAERQKIKDMFDNKFGPWDNLMENFTPASIHVSKADMTPDVVGKTIQEYADSIGKDPYDVLFDTIVANKADAIASFDCMCEEDIETIMKKEYCMVGSDGIDVSPEENTHPRLTGTFPRVLGRYVRGRNIISLELAIKKMTSLPAEVFGLDGKGILREGYDADVCIFDKSRIIDKSTYENFNIRPEGIDRVVVGGKIALKDGEYTGAASGSFVKGIHR